MTAQAEAYEQELEARFAPLDQPQGLARVPVACDHGQCPCPRCGHYDEPEDE